MCVVSEAHPLEAEGDCVALRGVPWHLCPLLCARVPRGTGCPGADASVQGLTGEAGGGMHDASPAFEGCAQAGRAPGEQARGSSPARGLGTCTPMRGAQFLRLCRASPLAE